LTYDGIDHLLGDVVAHRLAEGSGWVEVVLGAGGEQQQENGEGKNPGPCSASYFRM
jgi:hypothetical protein